MNRCTSTRQGKNTGSQSGKGVSRANTTCTKKGATRAAPPRATHARHAWTTIVLILNTRYEIDSYEATWSRTRVTDANARVALRRVDAWHKLGS